MDFYSGAIKLAEEEVTGPCTCSRTNLRVSLVMTDVPSIFTDLQFTTNFSKKIPVFILNDRRKGKYFLLELMGYH